MTKGSSKDNHHTAAPIRSLRSCAFLHLRRGSQHGTCLSTALLTLLTSIHFTFQHPGAAWDNKHSSSNSLSTASV
jgi:hypothetical protein